MTPSDRSMISSDSLCSKEILSSPPLRMPKKPVWLHLAVTLLLALWLPVCSSHASGQSGRVFFVQPAGDDKNSGLSPEQAWRTIDRVNAANFTPGDQILFSGGATYNGRLRFDAGDSATTSDRLVLSSSGDARAIIDGGNGSGLVAEDCHHLTIKNLVFRGSGRKAGNEADGVYITRCRQVEVDSIEVHGFQHAGVLVHICDSVRITHVYAHDNGFAGIHVTGTTIWDSSRYDNHHLYIGQCIAENNPGDPTVIDNHSGNGILASSTDRGLIEYCEAFNNGWDMPWHGNGPVGIWIWDSRNFIIQHCISHDNKSAPDAADGGGFDLDGGTSDSIIQYCLSFDNQGPGIGLFEFGAGKVWQNNVIRYNISQDDGKNGQGSLAIWKGEAGGAIRNCDIYNNTFYNSNQNGPNLCVQNNWQGFRFFNNVFVYNGPFLMAGNRLQDERFENNCYWNLSGNQEFLNHVNIRTWAEETGNEMRGGRFVGIYAEPRLYNSGGARLTFPLLLHGPLTEYQPISASPLIDAGLNLEKMYGVNPGERDIRGTSIP
ncbi:hypothetical protein EH222_13970, partial [candidate division KSB1 bacterium]